MKLCKDCKWFTPVLDKYIRHLGQCNRPNGLGTMAERNSLDLNKCGPEGKFFEPKESEAKQGE